MVFARRTNQRAICPRTAQTKKQKSMICNKLQNGLGKKKKKASREERIACENALLAQKQAEGFKKEQKELKRKKP